MTVLIPRGWESRRSDGREAGHDAAPKLYRGDQMSVWDEVRFWAQVIGDARRTIVCSPELESRLKMSIAARGLDGIYTVEVSRFVPDNRVIIIDQQAIDSLSRTPSAS